MLVDKFKTTPESYKTMTCYVCVDQVFSIDES